MRNSATHKYMENLNSAGQMILFVLLTLPPQARQTFFYVQEAGDFCTFPHTLQKEKI